MEQPQTPKQISYVLIDAGAIAGIIVEECGASMITAIIAADRILEYLQNIEGRGR